MRTSRRCPHPAPPLLAPRGPPPLPGLAAVPGTITLVQGQPGLADLAATLVRARAATPDDWDPGNPGPHALVERALDRTVARLNRRAPGVLPLGGFIRPWADLLKDVFGECPDEDDRRWVLGIECDETHRLRVAPLVDCFGEPATAAVLSRLIQHTPLCTGGPEDLEWIIDGWWTAAAESGREAEEIHRRAEGAVELSGRIDRLLDLGRSVPLDAVRPARVRRLLELLRALDRTAPAACDTAWRETEGTEWSLPRPVVHLVWEDGCPLAHAVDEAEFLNEQDGSYAMPQHMWLLDPADPDAAVAAWRRWVHALRQGATAARLVGAVETLSSSSTPHP
jgi:hypothetical protein